MGLDMYAYAREEKPATEVDFDMGVPGSEFAGELIHQWRKHPNLHGWMQKLYNSKGGEDQDFNVRPVVLTTSDLDALVVAVVKSDLPETQGFFFGQSSEEDKVRDLEFIAKARLAIEKGLTVYYYAWW